MIKYLLAFFFITYNSYAALEVTIAQGKVEPTPIAITQVLVRMRIPPDTVIL